EEVAARAVQDIRALVPCDIRADEAGCAAGFIEDFAGRAYRRPLTDADRQALQAVFEYGRSTESFVTGIRLVIETVLQSPHFLYRVEVEGVAEGEGRVRL